MSEYTEQADHFLEKCGISFSATLIGSGCPKWCEDAIKGRDMDKINTFPRKTHIHGKHYLCVLHREGRRDIVIDFWNSYHDEEFNYCLKNMNRASYSAPRYLLDMFKRHGFTERPGQFGWNNFKDKTVKAPTAYDVLSCIQKYDPGKFEEFCREFGYDTDSRRAEDTWRARVDQWKDVERFFTAEELEELREIQ